MLPSMMLLLCCFRHVDRSAFLRDVYADVDADFLRVDFIDKIEDAFKTLQPFSIGAVACYIAPFADYIFFFKAIF